jgi:hypothetical protein
LRADLAGPWPFSADGRVSGTVGVVVDPVLTPLARSQESRVLARVAGVPSRFPEDWKIDLDVDVGIRVPEFARAVRRLERTAWAVPAPLNTLQGTIELEAKGKTTIGPGLAGGSIPLGLRTRLDSDAAAAQRIHLDGSGRLRILRRGDERPEQQAGRVEEPPLSAHLEFRLGLSDVQLAAPRLDLARPPRFFPDSRVSRTRQEEPPPEGGTSAFTYDVEVVTPGLPIRILSERTRTPVPVRLTARAGTDRPVEGSVRVDNFRLEKFFRLKATVEKLAIDFKTEGESQASVDGSIRVDLTDYEIHVAATGPIEAPTYRFWSEPPLPENQIFAVLLFGRPLDELDPDQARSASDFQQATALNRGLGLASFFLFSSTPIESVALDPDSGEVDVRVRLAQGTSLTLGGTSSDPVRSVGIRRRLSRFWTLSTEVTGQDVSSAATSASSRTLSTFLEWSRRY